MEMEHGLHPERVENIRHAVHLYKQSEYSLYAQKVQGQRLWKNVWSGGSFSLVPQRQLIRVTGPDLYPERNMNTMSECHLLCVEIIQR